MSRPLLEIEDLRVEYLTERGRVCVVDDVSLAIGRGEIVGLAGESGSGKSTVALAILRLLKAPAAITGGHIWFEGRDLLSLGETELRRVRGKQIALVTQSAMNALNPVTTIGEQLADGIMAHEGVSAARAMARARSALERVGVDGARIASYPHELSGGMRQRAVIAMALALEPELVLMDEPTTALDVVVQRDILQQMSQLRDERGFSILFITHDLSLMLSLCSRIGVLYAGRLVEAAPARRLGAAPRHPYTRGLLECFPELDGPAGGAPDRLVGIPGTPPDPRDPPPGCRFHPRCAHATPECRTTAPPRTQLAGEHEVSCHLLP